MDPKMLACSKTNSDQNERDWRDYHSQPQNTLHNDKNNFLLTQKTDI